ncbi:MAG: carbamoyltransferase HypF [Pseudomonadota bacterium]
MTAGPALTDRPGTRPVARRRLDIEGVVQGVGFRPFVYNLARRHGLTGWTANAGDGLSIEVEGDDVSISDFAANLLRSAPPLARIDTVRQSDLAAKGDATFVIAESRSTGSAPMIVPPDVGTCDNCLAEVRDPANRRYRYPFTNCTDCGPRFSIIRALPYDRANTTMAGFAMCPDCAAEYADPSDRRYHAQPNACRVCGPTLAFLDSNGRSIATGDEALTRAIWSLRGGKIVAVKGLGGFHLMVDARDAGAVARLRARKNRPAKPLALMLPSVEAAEDLCIVSADERTALTSAARPIVLLRRRRNARDGQPCAAVAPDQPGLGIMLPATPLHHLLMDALDFPIVATSGNRSGEPMAIDRDQAIGRLTGIADCYLDHDRPIARPIDDSVVREIAGGITQIRRARGYAPLPLRLARELPEVLALGGQMKAAPAAIRGDRLIVWPHIGDLDHPEARAAYEDGLSAFRTAYALDPKRIACDPHPDYHTSTVAAANGEPVASVQHHVAHVAACLAENREMGPALGVAWDGTGWGEDGTVWGGEFFHVVDGAMTRAAHLLPFPLPGGEAAVREPRRCAIGLLRTILGKLWVERDDLAPIASLSRPERDLLDRMMARDLNSPLTSSMGRLFDGVASLLGLKQRCSFEGEAAMALEAALGENLAAAADAYALPCQPDEASMILDWRPLIADVLVDLSDFVPTSVIAARFHRALAEAVVAVAKQVGEPKVALSGGCFQNRALTELTVIQLRAAGFTPLLHRALPPNDGGLAAGQAVWAAQQLMAEDV